MPRGNVATREDAPAQPGWHTRGANNKQRDRGRAQSQATIAAAAAHPTANNVQRTITACHDSFVLPIVATEFLVRSVARIDLVQT